MNSNEKKVILFIVEGPSDEATIGSIMKEYFIGNQVQFFVVHGDITVKDYVSVDNIIKRIDELVEKVKGRYRYKTSDFMKIIQLVDTDGVFIPNKQVHEADVNSIMYYEEHMDTKSPENTLKRNHTKAQLLLKLRTTGKIKSIPYRIYFNSCNLEHVLYNELKDFSDAKKEQMSDDFAEKYENNVTEFIAFISEESVAVPGTYQETWKYIEKDCNSLNRHSNMHLIFKE